MAGHLDPRAVRCLLIGVTIGGGGLAIGGERVGVGVGFRARWRGRRWRGECSQNGDRTSDDRLRDSHGNFSERIEITLSEIKTIGRFLASPSRFRLSSEALA